MSGVIQLNKDEEVLPSRDQGSTEGEKVVIQDSAFAGDLNVSIDQSTSSGPRECKSCGATGHQTFFPCPTEKCTNSYCEHCGVHECIICSQNKRLENKLVNMRKSSLDIQTEHVDQIEGIQTEHVTQIESMRKDFSSRGIDWVRNLFPIAIICMDTILLSLLATGAVLNASHWIEISSYAFILSVALLSIIRYRWLSLLENSHTYMSGNGALFLFLAPIVISLLGWSLSLRIHSPVSFFIVFTIVLLALFGCLNWKDYEGFPNVPPGFSWSPHNLWQLSTLNLSFLFLVGLLL